jgi:lysyl-tRNA synthetase class 2
MSSPIDEFDAKSPELSPSEKAALPPWTLSLPPLIQAQILKAAKLREGGIALYPNGFRPGASAASIRAEFGEMTREELEGQSHSRSMSGRLMARRDHGKTSFFTARDSTGNVQLYLRRDEVPPEVWELSKQLDIGDLVGVAGDVFKTKTGELTLRLTHLELVTKALWPLPEKFHELDVEMKYRRRYVDLFMSEESRRVFRIRSQTVDYLRRFMAERDFLEVETPMMHPIPGGANALPFKTFHNALKQEFFLRVAPELYLKRLLVGGLERVFELNRNFRNEGLSVKHNPEFTTLEFYQSFATYEDLMDLTEELLDGLATTILGTTDLVYQGAPISLKAPFKRYSYRESLVALGGAPPEALTSASVALAFIQSLKPDFAPKGEMSLVALQGEIFDLAVEKKIADPTFITAYPTEISPLARKNDADPTVTDRFELFILGREFANAFSELNDPLDQYERFLAQVAEREKGDEEGMYLDRDYVRALMYGMPPAAGEGVGVDRLVMLLTDSPSIRDVLFFPQMRPES